MLFELMHKDIKVATVDLEEHSGVLVTVPEVSDIDHMPVGTVVDGSLRPDRLHSWWSSRSIPATRSGVRALMEDMDIPRTEFLLTKSMGLSLSDQYWIRLPGSGLRWSDVNFFENPFSDDLGDLLFGKSVWTGSMDLSSPDSASDGLLMKRWTRMDGKCYLIKSGTRPFMQEPFNEVAAGIIAESLGADHVDYSVIEYDEAPCCICEDFVTPDTELVSANQVMRSEIHDAGISGYDHYVTCCRHHGLDVRPAIDRMLVLDYIIANGDRHTNNFGILRDAETLEWLRPAPIYDSRSSMGHDIWEDSIVSEAGETCKPFAEYWSVQMRYVRDLSWVDADALTEAVERAADVFSGISEYRRKGRDRAIAELLRSRAADVIARARE